MIDRVIAVYPRELDTKRFVKRAAKESDAEWVIERPCIVENGGGQVVAVFGRFEEKKLSGIRSAAEKIRYETSTRTGGLKTTSRIFGFMPRNVIRKDFCGSVSLSLQEPRYHHALTDFGMELSDVYARHAPEIYKKHARKIEQEVKQDWVMLGTPFTSGIINKNNSLKYHFDSGNYDGFFSCMVVLRKNIEGGRLCIPQWNVKFDLPDGAFLLFDGQSVLHGVTPIKRLNSKSYRYSAVYYSLKTMKNCLSPKEEISRIRIVKRKREQGRV